MRTLIFDEPDASCEIDGDRGVQNAARPEDDMASIDVLIKNGTVVDGDGAPPRVADVAIADGMIVEVGPNISGVAGRTMDAEGLLVTPGFIDVHTHYDGQALWDDRLDPSFGHGVTTVVMGNCGVGFAPVKPGGQGDLIDIMEGVEDIPGVVLDESIPWGAWESYPEFLDFLGSRKYGLDVASNITHGSLRAYVMGHEDLFQKVANDDQIEQLAQLVLEGMRAGAVGLSTNRAIGHRALSGEPVPGTFAAENELSAMVKAMGSTNAGLLQLIPGGGMGAPAGVGADWTGFQDEVPLMGRLSRLSGRPVTFTMFQLPDDPEGWRQNMAMTLAENANGAQICPQISARQLGMLTSLSSYHPLMRRETYLKIRHLPLAERVREMRKPEVKAAILSDRDILDENPGSTENFLCILLRDNLSRLFPLGEHVFYEPDLGDTIGGIAQRTGESEASIFYDRMLDLDGRAILMQFDANYKYGNFDVVHEMISHPATVNALTDAGAHVRYICDASTPTHTLSYFCRDRTRGAKLPLEVAVAKQSSKAADLYGMSDRGRLVAGKRADINVIDFERLKLDLPEMHYDLPSGAGRFLQKAQGYRATMVKGVVTRENDEDTGQRPGRLVRGAGAVN
ncbi:MAG: D-aminoacylase [Phenylobacterium sp.]|nr:MAG: D-aminoacylase [Phenylobacterium sp.]